MIQSGIDVGKSKVDLCLLPEGAKGRKKTKVLNNTPQVVAAVLEWVPPPAEINELRALYLQRSPFSLPLPVLSRISF